MNTTLISATGFDHRPLCRSYVCIAFGATSPQCDSDSGDRFSWPLLPSGALSPGRTNQTTSCTAADDVLSRSFVNSSASVQWVAEPSWVDKIPQWNAESRRQLAHAIDGQVASGAFNVTNKRAAQASFITKRVLRHTSQEACSFQVLAKNQSIVGGLVRLCHQWRASKNDSSCATMFESPCDLFESHLSLSERQNDF